MASIPRMSINPDTALIAGCLWATVLVASNDLPQNALAALYYSLPKFVVLVGFIALIQLWNIMSEIPVPITHSISNRAFLIFLCVGGLSAVWNQSSVGLSLLAFFEPLVVLCLVGATRRCAAALRQYEFLASAIVVSGIILAALVIVESLGWVHFTNLPRRPIATVGNRNTAGEFLVISLPLLTAWVLKKRDNKYWILLSCSLVCVLVAILLCRSRSSWIALIATAATGLWVARDRFSIRRMLPIPCVLIISLIVVLSISWKGLRWRDPNPLWKSFVSLIDVEEGSGRARLDQFRISYQMLRESPLIGIGPGNWRKLAPLYTHAAAVPPSFVSLVKFPNSDWARFLTEYGILGFIFLGTACGLLLTKSLSQKSDLDQTGVVLGILAFGIIALIDYPFERLPTLVLFAILTGLVRDPTRSRLGTTRFRPIALNLATGLCVVCVLSTAWLYHGSMMNLRKPISEKHILEPARLAPLEASLWLSAVLPSLSSCQAYRERVRVILEGYPNEIGVLRFAEHCAGLAADPLARDHFRQRISSLEPHKRLPARWP